MSTLFELSDEVMNLNYVLETLDEENEDITTVIDEYLAGVKGDLNTKLDNYAGLITELQARSSVRREEAERLAHRAKVDFNKVARLKEALKWYFLTHDMKTTIETPRYRLTLAPNGGKERLLITVPVEELPPDFILATTTYRPDMEAIRAALEDGAEVPGVELGERGFNIRIM